ncbi:MAG: response regulator [Lachnospiraceae bacterium]|nr:response regulator [Lachnospiraceae bacterium]
MSRGNEENEVFKSSHMILLLCFSAFALILIGECILMDWERWALVLVIAALCGAWVMHIQQILAPNARLWIYAVMMMILYFFYGTHMTSTFDTALIMVVVIMIYSITCVRSLIWVCQGTFYITFAYDILMLITMGEKFDVLAVSRAFLHVVVVTMAGWIGRMIIDNWNGVTMRTRKEIEELKGATERLDNFLANVSHEIRTPVNAVIGLTAVIEKEDLPDGAQANIRAISEAGHRVSEQISDILDFTEIDMGKLAVTRETYMIDSLINDLLVQLSFTENYGLDLIVDMDAHIPSELLGDGSKIKKILWHLISNGFKFTKEGGVYVHIYHVRRDYGINLVLEVRDTGIGMSETEIEHAYEKFYQSDSGKTRTAGGLGLGIPIISGFTRAMDGVLAIESDEGEGTTVRVSIPQEVENDAPCLTVRDKDNCVVVGFLGFMTTGHQSVRDFHMEMVNHLVSGLGIGFKRVQSREELERIIRNEKVTHLFVGTGEYLENMEYIDKIASEMNVAVVADRGFNGIVGRRVQLLPKPFYGAQVVNFLNHTFDGNEETREERMTCPGLKVLVVDDEPMNLLVARGIFETYGMIVSTASNGPEAIEMCSVEDYALVFMDHMMPEMDGVEAMKRIRFNASRFRKDICIVALTANAISSAKEMFMSEGFDGFIPKPIEISELERVLRRVLPKSAIVFEKVDASSEKDTKKGASDKKENGIMSLNSVSRSAVSSSIPSELASLRKAGVEPEDGLRYCRGDVEFYKTLLLEYSKNVSKKIAELKKYYDTSDWSDYSIRVHAVKSTSKMIGAAEISALAKFLEDASKASDVKMIDTRHDEFMSGYEKLMKAINSALGAEGSDPASGESGKAADFSPEEEDDEIMEFAPEGDK